MKKTNMFIVSILLFSFFTGFHVVEICKATENNSPPSVVLNANPIEGSEPLYVEFTWSANDFNGEIVSQDLDYGNGWITSGDSPKDQVYWEGTYNVTITVTDNDGATASDSIKIEVEAESSYKYPIDDSFVWFKYPSQNNGDQPSLSVVNWNFYGLQLKESYLKFDLSEIPSDTTINCATLRLYGSSNNGFNDTFVKVHRSNDVSWDEDTITWDNKPSYSSSYSDNIIINYDSDEWHEWNVTSYVKEALSSGLLTLVLTTSNDGIASFESKESFYARSPELIINNLSYCKNTNNGNDIDDGKTNEDTEDDKNNGIPGFEIILLIIAVFSILVLNRKKQI